MSVTRYRSVREMPERSRFRRGEPELWNAIRTLWAFSARLRPRRFPCGVHKHRNMDDLNALTEHWRREDDRRTRAVRAGRAAAGVIRPVLEP